jgi:hypothetical protein
MEVKWVFLENKFLGKKHGESVFFDLNLKSENENLEIARNFFLRVANFHKVSLSDSLTNEEYILSKN